MSGEVTTGAKVQPSSDPKNRIFYSSELSNIALERTRTAKDAVTLVGQLIDQYGYYGTGETLLFADPKEAWVIEMCGGTPDGRGGLWAAQKVPDGEIFVTANTFRIRDVVPGNSNQMYSANLFSVATKNGWWNESDGNLDWLKTVSNGEYSHPYYSLARVWSLYSRIAPSRNLSPYVTDTYSKDYPFSLSPDKKLTTADAFALFRNHYEGTVYDLTTGPAAGPFGNPYRWRGPFDDHGHFAFGEVKPGAWPRAVSEMFCGYSYINQGRSWLPDPIGGIVWFGFAQPAETVYVPFYAGATSVPAEWSQNDRSTFSRDYAWWAFNYVTNWATINYNAMIGDIRARQQAIEQRQFADQPVVEENAQKIYYSEGEAATRAYLTTYSTANALANANDWWKLSDQLVVKYSNMMVNDFANGTTAMPGYPDGWLQDAGYQYGPRIYPDKELQNVVGLAYVNMTLYTTPDNELNLIRETQRTNRTMLIIGIIEGRVPLPARNLTHRIMKTG
jgi:dipeptidase